MKVLLTFLLSSSVFAAQDKVNEQMLLIDQVALYLAKDKEDLKAEQITSLSKKIIPNKHEYPSDVIAKLFLLLADVATNKGDIDKAYQFTLDGLAVNTSHKKIRLCLTLKLAEIYVTKKQFSLLLSAAEQAVVQSEMTNNVKYKLFALGYRSVAFAMLGKHQKTLMDLEQVELSISSNKVFSEHIELLTILAKAYQALGDYQTALTIHNKVLTLRFELSRLANLDQTYIQMAHAYLALRRFDDAYNSYWEAKKYAQKKSADINVANAQQGIGIVYYKQNDLDNALLELSSANDIYKKRNMILPYVETAIYIAEIKLKRKEFEHSYILLNEIQTLIVESEMNIDVLSFYNMVSQMHFNKQEYQKAFLWQEKYSQALQNKNKQQKRLDLIPSYFSSVISEDEKETIEPLDLARELTIKMAEKSELSSSFDAKFKKQNAIIFILSLVSLLLLALLLFFFFRIRAKRLSLVYQEAETPANFFLKSMHTKHNYQLLYKKARQYQYPLTVVSLTIDNWQELTFRFNKKSIINEVCNDIAKVISEHLDEYDCAGILNEGEYLLLFEYQNEDEIVQKVDKLSEALQVRFIASIGDFSILSKYAIKTPNFKDIDPYIFLAKLTESKDL
ncbi:lipopolysaccharide assembly protein LapB [Colwellia sp. RSH04]|uniref:tetratricopeptide repeat protein n=1 Tax=Colwellia sp. RSH04 TaxID=2305464 RepID=UPI000E57A0EA|nr:hypothetical protein [Colwellia sp. RSH04]RHW76853.1 hypothetical protein D1094_07160 [Colwellia sp. RSH04]